MLYCMVHISGRGLLHAYRYLPFPFWAYMPCPSDLYIKYTGTSFMYIFYIYLLSFGNHHFYVGGDDGTPVFYLIFVHGMVMTAAWRDGLVYALLSPAICYKRDLIKPWR